MKNRNSQFRKILLIPLIACLAVFFSAAAAQADEAPFVGVVSGTFPADLGAPLPGSGGCVFSVPVINGGRATLLRDFTGTATFIFNACDGTYFGTYEWVSSRGGSIYGLFAGHIEPTDEEGVFNNFEVAVASGGTCRFANATGYFTLGGQINFITSSFEAPFEGAISRP
jgi:hypothetical protein